ncbi:hypothetical protein BCIN_15g05250 [Botrytis cinerea B05.10]|uniref:Uncharacterized protein n=2 Tax=Botryotinia fuckeliana (strain B05.10) TaxID=332648 RepID=A0A384K5F3_BOTFB|nr:hypothetical protein BCIN_15g05250 [Botrytis cinerea B05.10]XP_024553527.1 hypothetical protein BCIN_15g05250 [Botrytis cinerea B05.10]ATZ58056.1 hypothetical protein BCIN_15g05250 [Botrytis cinerea B05.10]ATZ58057.1 hypothetical protein BCIN_15g05250 [Botrytis cinerea B05.10]
MDYQSIHGPGRSNFSSSSPRKYSFHHNSLRHSAASLTIDRLTHSKIVCLQFPPLKRCKI